MSRNLTIAATVFLLCGARATADENHGLASDAAKRQYRLLIDEFEEEGEARESARSFIALAAKYPQSPVAVDALVWIVSNVSRGKDLERATALLAKSHVKSKRLAPVCQKLPSRLSQASEDLLRALRAESPDKDVRAQASYHLAVYLQRQLQLHDLIKNKSADLQRFEQFYGKGFIDHVVELNASASLEEIETIYEDVAWKFSNIRLWDSTMGQTVRRELYAIRNLSVGRTAPEITGQDVDGKTFKLSDYRGKVVLLDFWGHW